MVVELAVARKCSQRVMSTEQSIAIVYPDMLLLHDGYLPYLHVCAESSILGALT